MPPDDAGGVRVRVYRGLGIMAKENDFPLQAGKSLFQEWYTNIIGMNSSGYTNTASFVFHTPTPEATARAIQPMIFVQSIAFPFHF